jgi:hypothetical protein
MAMPADNKPNTPISDAVGDSWREIIRAANVPDVADEAMIPIEKPTGLHRYVWRPVRVPEDPLLTRQQRIHQQEWSVITFEEGSNGTERLEWRDVPLVTEDWTEVPLSDEFRQAMDEVAERRRRGLPDYEKPPLGQPPAFLQEQELKSGGGTLFRSKEELDEAVKSFSREILASEERSTRVDGSLAKQLQTSMERNASLIGELRKLQDIIDGQAERILKMEEALEWIFNNPEAHWATTAMIAGKGLGRNR